jgi:site-specific recombinase XerD
MEAVITIYHDLRRQKTNGTYPVKIRVYDGNERKYYPTGVDLTEEDFEKVVKGDRLKADLKKAKDKLDEKKADATRIASKMDHFDINAFDRKFKRPASSGTDVLFYYKLKIEECKKADSVKNAIVYGNSRDSILKYLKPNTPIKELHEAGIRLNFKDVTVKWLNAYQKWMTDKGHSLTTVSIYMRNLRTIFNMAIHEKDITQDVYPFGEKKYMIPTGANVKQALEKEDLKKLWEYKTDDELIIKARDFWFFIYNAYGMNVRDIVLLRPADIIGDKIYYVRAKTKNTTKKETKIEVHITEHMQSVIKRYKSNGYYLFDFIKGNMTAAEKVRASDALVKFINDHMERLAKACGVTASCSTYAARHSFGTNAIRNGASMELIQQLFGHQNLTTTQNYFAGFGDVVKKQVSNQLMNF